MSDLCRFLAPRRPEIVRQILNAFYLEDEGVTKAELMRQVGLKQRTLEYYITRLRRWRVIRTSRRHSPARYFLEPKMFHARIDTLLVDPLHHFRAPKPWQSGERAEAAA